MMRMKTHSDMATVLAVSLYVCPFGTFCVRQTCSSTSVSWTEKCNLTMPWIVLTSLFASPVRHSSLPLLLCSICLSVLNRLYLSSSCVPFARPSSHPSLASFTLHTFACGCCCVSVCLQLVIPNLFLCGFTLATLDFVFCLDSPHLLFFCCLSLYF